MCTSKQVRPKNWSGYEFDRDNKPIAAPETIYEDKSSDSVYLHGRDTSTNHTGWMPEDGEWVRAWADSEWAECLYDTNMLFWGHPFSSFLYDLFPLRLYLLKMGGARKGCAQRPFGS